MLYQSLLQIGRVPVIPALSILMTGWVMQALPAASREVATANLSSATDNPAQEAAQKVCPALCAESGAQWSGRWRTQVTAGKRRMVCQCGQRTTPGSPAPTNGTASTGGGAISQQILAAHNKYRAEVKVTSVTWSNALAQDAQKWANHLASLGGQQLIHSPNNQRPNQGENLWMGTAGYFSLMQMVDSWGEEKRYFRNGAFPNVSSTGNWADVGHYTQIVWRKTTQIGCGMAKAGGNDILVCRYSPPGNYMGEKTF
jgi:hypothetical protein